MSMAAAENLRRCHRHVPLYGNTDMLGNLGFSELAVILVICLVLFGAKRIPEIGSSIGKGIREFKRGVSEIHDSALGSVQPAGEAPTQRMSSERTSTERMAPDHELAEPKRLL
jgi:sec-independent protein translocase protein TatA